LAEEIAVRQVDDGRNRNKGDMTTSRARRFVTSTLVALTVALLLSGCSHGPSRSSLAGGVAPPAPADTATTESPTTSPPLTASSLVLAADGLGPLTFGIQAARALGALTQALGQSDPPTAVAASPSCHATRMFHWRNLAVLVNEVMPGAGTTAGLVGWSVSVGSRDALSMKTDKGIGVGSTLAALRSAYGAAVVITPAEPTPGFTISTPTGKITGELNGQAPGSTIRTLRAGTACGI
jgi:hypothetical protein